MLIDTIKRCCNLLNSLKETNNFSEEDLRDIVLTISFCNAIIEHYET